MGKMYTLKPDESINDHVKESMEIINHIVELSIGCMRDLANPHEVTSVDMTFNKFMRSLEHIRESIQMLDELCDEQDDDNFRLRSSLEKLTGKCPYHDKYCDYDDCGECEYARITVLKDMSENCEHFRELAVSRNKELEEERERSNQLEKRCSDLVRDRDDAVEYWTKHCEILLQKHREELAAKDHEIWEVQEKAEYWEDLAKEQAEWALRANIPKDIRKFNNPVNFCGNCKHFEMHAGDVGVCARLKNQNKYKVVDPDDASCSHFKSNNGVVIGKPEFPCCEHCSHEDCDDCTLCPF